MQVSVLLFSVYVVGLVAVVIYSIYGLIRNEWVYKVRMRELDHSISEYRKLPSYNEMLYEWWTWDVEKFKSGGGDREQCD